MLSINVIDVGVHGLGFTALWPGIGIFPDWVRREEFGIQNRNVVVENGIVHWSDSLKLEARPMIGVVGVAPVAGSVLTVDNGPHGGNMDIQEVTNGNVLMLPVYQEGAHLHVGDVHALQGDAECNGVGAIEIRGHLRMQVSLSPAPRRLTWPRIETPTHICTVGCARPLDDALRIAFEEMIYWLEEDYGMRGTRGVHVARTGRRSTLHADGQPEVHVYLQVSKTIPSGPVNSRGLRRVGPAETAAGRELTFRCPPTPNRSTMSGVRCHEEVEPGTPWAALS